MLIKQILSSLRPLNTCLNYSQMRSVMILKRKVRPLYGQRLKNPYIVGPLFNDILHYKEPREVTDMIYDEVEDTDDQSLGKMKVILMDHIEELGVAGDVVEVDASYARFHLLSARKAVYYCDYNLNKYKDLIESGAEGRVGPSSAFVLTTVRQLAKECILVEMNDKHEWLIQKRHIRIAFRKTGYTVPEEAIQLPEIPITGPDIEGKEGKDFAVHIVINNQETVAVRCMVHHLGQELAINWMRAPRFVLLPEQQSQLLAQMPVLPMLEEDKQLEEEYIS